MMKDRNLHHMLFENINLLYHCKVMCEEMQYARELSGRYEVQ